MLGIRTEKEVFMTAQELAKLAFDECCNPETSTRYGIKRGRPFWNVESTMFMYVPAFHFTAVRDCKRYLFTAVDEKGDVHTFEAPDCCALLTPIWAQLPEGVVKLTVTALREDGTEYATVGARTFFRSAPFPGVTPPAACSYKESAIKAYKYAMSQSFIQHWLKEGTPDPTYDLNIYPTKMIGALVEAMLSYARLCPEDAEDALRVAVNSADYLISITPRGNVGLPDLPPTYHLDFCPDPIAYGIDTPNYHAAQAHMGTMMMTYPPRAGGIYLDLEEVTGEKKYLEEALKIGNYYKNTVELNGSWYLVRSTETGEHLTENYISPLDSIVPFLSKLYKRTGDECWKQLMDKSIDYVLKTQLATYNWEGQFEDSPLSTNYMNLTHYGPMSLACYYAEFHKDEPECMEQAKELMRFVEDQFVIWNRPYPWMHSAPDDLPGYDTSLWHTPCGLEQYGWYVPIDASTSTILRGFLALYKAGCGSLYLAKAKALADQLTRVQHENGQIPTHWMNTPDAEANFWFNCMFDSCETLEIMAEYQDVQP